MSILCDKSTKVLVQGTGRAGQFHAKQCIDYGTQIVAGVAPREVHPRLSADHPQVGQLDPAVIAVQRDPPVGEPLDRQMGQSQVGDAPGQLQGALHRDGLR